MQIVRVAFPLPLYRTFDYLVADELQINLGVRVQAPFRQRRTIGMIVEIISVSEIPLSQLKSVYQVLDKQRLFDDVLWQLLHWAATYYHYPLGEILFDALPSKLRQGAVAAWPDQRQWSLTEQGVGIDVAKLKRAPKQLQALNLLRSSPLLHEHLLQAGVNHATLIQLQQKQLIVDQMLTTQPTLDTELIYPDQVIKQANTFKLSAEQIHAIEEISREKSGFKTWLLEGITGSGKTEVYLKVIEKALMQGQQILVLVPEIGLTPQMITRFKQRFNVPIEVLHSALNQSARLAVWLKAQAGLSAIVIGTRSAVFTPFARLGAIIIDEEHDSSYKQQEGWRYHARDLAVLRAKMGKIPIILGSATPSLASLYNVNQGKYHHLQLTKRAGNAKLATHLLQDIKGLYLKAGLTQPLLDRIRQHLDQNNQVLLFLNRRGYAPALLCHECGWIAECQHCDHYYTLHQHNQKLCCHHCDHQQPIPLKCPQCHSHKLIAVGVGTEQLEQTLMTLFPHIPITRIDRDTTSRKGSFEHYLETIQQGNARILIGTQMLAKGHHFPHVTLVALLDIDSFLFSADFHATERLAQLYTQVAGRSGRADKAGEVFLQTHHPMHPILQAILQQGYQHTANQLLQERQNNALPPFSSHILLRADDDDNQGAANFLQQVKQLLTTTKTDLWLLGPLPALQPKRKNRYRWQLLLQHPSRAILQSILLSNFTLIQQIPLTNKVRWSVDVDPVEC